MKKLNYFFGIFIFCLFLFPAFKVNAAVEVTDEASLRNALEQGGDIILKNDIELTHTLNIDKDVNIKGSNVYPRNSLSINSDEPLININGGKVNIEEMAFTSNNGPSLTINDGNVRMYTVEITSCRNSYPYACEGGEAMVVNGGTVNISHAYEITSGGVALTVNNDAKLYIDHSSIYSYEKNGLEINGGTCVSVDKNEIFGTQNAIYLNGGSLTLGGETLINTSTSGHAIYINKGVTNINNGSVLTLANDFVYSYDGITPNFNLYISPNIDVLKINDNKKFISLSNNIINLNFCSITLFHPEAQTEEEKRQVCQNLNALYDGPINSNELKSCSVVYINNEKYVVGGEEACNKANEPAQIVTVPPTKASSIYYVLTGVILVIIAAFAIYIVISKKKAK